MWWNPESRDLVGVSEAIAAARDLVGRGILGVGVAFLPNEPALAVVQSGSMDPRPGRWAEQATSRAQAPIVKRFASVLGCPPPPSLDGGFGATDGGVVVVEPPRSTRAVLRALLAAAVSARKADQRSLEAGHFVPLEQADDGTKAMIDDLPLGGVRVVVHYSRGRFTSTQRLRSTARRAWTSLGMVADLSGSQIVLTSGHLGARPGESIEHRQSKLPLWRHFGTCVAANDPRASDVTMPGIDLCVIAGHSAGAVVPIQPVIPQDVANQALAEWNGAKSGRNRGTRIGAEGALGAFESYTVENVEITHAWYVAGGCRGGDSGSAVRYMPDDRLLGQIVGVVGTRNRLGSGQGTVVQDAATLVDAAETLTGSQVQDIGVLAHLWD